ncbi:aminotransferase class III-fold pyridoxal phosphate-dependent enzyme [Haliea sp. E1-2-M8]|uniref:aminotransferase class III-fold pyridoxal phosphate-dependent enzyme n=1 Tax=Haliea sp. E1-2-M8 TaxID=3064706 RepID=UPI00271A654E|nr:aminotransferase class III-fold pyridoxal phosphate-dependent enzyme [Haliea sp. E1-2-M8]MDO8863597.1 aminotransferase class III-fold pyridoxal phosphate-dependent enzyme [Haliea sp. E1-2-M8]
MPNSIETYLLLVPAALVFSYLLWSRLRLSLAKHPSLRGHAKWSRRIARLVPYYSFGPEHYFSSDGAPHDVADQRRTGFARLLRHLHTRCPKSLEFGATLDTGISDVDFTSAYRVPFPYRDGLAKALRQGSIVDGSDGVRLRDIDGNWRYDLSGSYGVNVFGYDFYKECLAEAMRIAGPLGPVLGPYHPVIKDNVKRLQTISGLDEVSFHMSGTEAVMQAVRLARYHTGRSHLVRLCGAYHGWWDGVQPGVGNQRKTGDVYTLRDLSARTLSVLETRRDIACVLINPLQALHPNADAAGDATLVSSSRSAHFDRTSYTRWLEQVREVCTRRGIVLIFDEVFTGFRLAHRGAQEYFGIQADMVTYGKTLGGGLPVGVLCGSQQLMKRFKQEQPANIAFARGTFNSHPYVMAAMNVFLQRLDESYYQSLYRDADALWNERAKQLNDQLAAAQLPVRLVNMHSIWTVLYTIPSRYNWMFQFYLRDQGLELSWVGSGRLIMSLNYSDDDFAAVMQRFLDAARQMAMDGWWWQTEQLTHHTIQRQLAMEMLRARFGLQPAAGRSSAATDSIDAITGRTP